MPLDSRSPIEIPERYEDVTAEWLTQALRAGGVLGDQSVKSFNLEPISASKSRTSSLARITVEYDEHSEELPASVFAKFVSRIPQNREFAREGDLFRREVALYRTFGSEMPLKIPKMYFGAAKEASDIGVLLLEEIHGASESDLPIDEMSLNPNKARLALNEISKMHAKWWRDQSINDHTWLRRIDDPFRLLRYETYEEAWVKLRPVMEPVWSDAELQICDKIASYLPGLVSKLEKMPMTLCHSDFHAGNLLWNKTPEPEAVWTLDWQGPAIAPAVTDVSWFLGIGIPTQDLHLVQKEFLPFYHSALVMNGVEDYEYERFFSDYMYGLIDGLSKMIWILSRIDLAHDDSSNFVRILVGRMAAAAEDAGCGEFIS